MSGAYSGAAVRDGLVGDGELSQVVPEHFRFDLHLVEGASVVHAHHVVDHLRHDDHVPQVRLDAGGLLLLHRFLLRLAQPLDQRHRLPAESADEAAARARVHQLDELLVVHVQQLVQVHAAVRELPEHALLLGLIAHS